MEVGIQRPRRDGVLNTVPQKNTVEDHTPNVDDELDPLIDERPSRYIVGIDLGTTNSAVTYIDTQEEPWNIRVLPDAPTGRTRRD